MLLVIAILVKNVCDCNVGKTGSGEYNAGEEDSTDRNAGEEGSGGCNASEDVKKAMGIAMLVKFDDCYAGEVGSRDCK